MNDLLIIQARMSSTRFPGKVLSPLAGKPLLEHVIDRVKRSAVKHVVVATSMDVSDNPIYVFCQSIGIECFRGRLEDVASRFQSLLQKTKAERFVRICADSPLIDFTLIDQAVRIFNTTDVDLVTNIFPRTFPKGQSVEVVRTDVFLKIQPFFTAEQQEHVTKYFYENASQFKIKNFSSGGLWNGHSMCVDTPQEMERMQRFFKEAGDSIYHKGWHELMGLIEKYEVSL